MADSRTKIFLEKRDPWGHGVALWIIAAVALLLPLTIWSLGHIRLHNDVAGWLPKNDPQSRILSWYQRQFPSEDRILVSWDTASLTDPRLQKFAEELAGRTLPSGRTEGGSPLIEDVVLPQDLISRMLDRDVAAETAVRRIEGVLTGLGPLQIRLTDAGRMRGEYMQTEILHLAREEFGLEASFVSRTMPLPSSAGLELEDSKAWKLHDSLTEYVQSQPLHDLQLTWPQIHSQPETLTAFRKALLQLSAPASGTQTSGKTCVEDAFFVSGSMAAVAVVLSESGGADRDAAINAIRSAAVAAGVDDAELHLGGQPVASVALNQAVRRAGWNPAFSIWNVPQRSPMLLSAIVVIVTSFLMLRSVRLAILVQVVALIAVAVSVSLVPLTGGTLNMVLVVMPTLLAVLTTSAAIHLANYWKHSAVADPSRSVFRAAKTAWLPCALASATTAIGLASLLASNLVPVRDFGIYSAAGCVISFLLVLYFLPALMLYWPKAPPPESELRTGHWNILGHWIVRHRHAVAIWCVVSTVACGYGLVHFRTETKVIRYFPTDSRLVQDYAYLEDNLSGVVSIDTIVRFDRQTQDEVSFIERARKVMEIQQDIRQHAEVSGVLSLASFLDLRQPDVENMSALQRMKLNKSQNEMGRRIHERVAAGGAEAEGISSFIAIPREATDLTVPGDHGLNAAGDELWRITAQTAIMSDANYSQLTADMDRIASRHLSLVGSPGTGHVVTGLIPVFLRTQQAVLESLIRSFGMAFVLIAVVMMVVLKSPRAGVVTMLPNLMPVVMVFGLLSWAGLRVDMGTMITASVALGIAVDGTLHLLTWFQELVKRGRSVPDAVAEALENCGPAMWQTSAAIGLGMLTLLGAELLLISRFGWMLAALIFAALAADVIFLPALLAGPLGYIIQKSVTATPEPAEAPAAGNDATLTAEVDDSVEGICISGTQSQRSPRGAGSRPDLRPHLDEISSVRGGRSLDRTATPGIDD
ncbi:MAG: MMPL family transporter [Planctomycetaceae bacterium]